MVCIKICIDLTPQFREQGKLIIIQHLPDTRINSLVRKILELDKSYTFVSQVEQSDPFVSLRRDLWSSSFFVPRACGTMALADGFSPPPYSSQVSEREGVPKKMYLPDVHVKHYGLISSNSPEKLIFLQKPIVIFIELLKGEFPISVFFCHNSLVRLTNYIDYLAGIIDKPDKNQTSFQRNNIRNTILKFSHGLQTP